MISEQFANTHFSSNLGTQSNNSPPFFFLSLSLPAAQVMVSLSASHLLKRPAF